MSLQLFAMIQNLTKRVEALEQQNLLKTVSSTQDSSKSAEPVGQKTPLGLKKAG
jgi:hypothetical protein